MAGLAATFGSGAMTNSIVELQNADCIFVIGSNTMEQHPLIATRILAAKEKGAKLVVVDPRRTSLVAYANVHLQINPGTDIALINGIMNIIINDKLTDDTFIDARTEDFSALREKVQQYPPQKVAEICGVDAKDLQEAAHLYGKAKASSIVYCMGITQHTTGTNNVKSLANLAMMTGNIGKPSTGVNPLRGQNNVQGACDMGALPVVFTGYQSVTDDTIRQKFEKAWDCSLSGKAGLPLTAMFDASYKGELKGMFVIGENPVLSEPDKTHCEEALNKLELLVVQDIFLTETAQMADVVLPAASFAEKDGTFSATDRRVTRIRKVIEPVGESKPDWVIICELARLMGGKQFGYNSPAEVMEEIAKLTPSYGGISYERLDNGEILPWPCPTKDHPGTPILHKENFTRGKGKFFAIDHVPPAEMPDSEFPLILTTGRSMFHYHTGTMTRKAPALEKQVSHALLEINPQDAEKLGIVDDSDITVKSRRGEVQVKAFVTDRVNTGVVFLPFHFAEAPANVLTIDKRDPDAKIPEFKVCAVNVSKRG